MNLTEYEPPLTLYAGDARLGILTYKDMDWPVTYFAFEPTPEFENYRHILDVHGNRSAFKENMAAAEKLDLRVIREDGICIKMLSVFIDGNNATLRQGLIRLEPVSDPK
jgi:hypothetical protein